MLVYWLLFAFFALGALLEGAPQGRPKAGVLLALGAILLALLIGFRYEVGADWLPYVAIYARTGHLHLTSVLRLIDPGYQALNWLAQQAGLGLWAVNFVCGTIFAWGLYRFCRVQPLPWLAFLVAIPYLGIVVAMGYTRQAVALGFIMAGLAAVVRGGSGLRFAAYVAAAALFHRTAIIALPLVVFSGQRSRLLNFVVAIAVVIAAYDLFLSSSLERLFNLYLGTEMNSQGAAIRIALVTLPAILFLLNRRRFAFPDREDRIWRNFSIATLVALVGLFVFSSSTAVDRASLYLLPLEIVILARVPLVFHAPVFGRVAVVALSASVLAVWMNFAAHSRDWLPYRFFPVGSDVASVSPYRR